MLLTQSRPTLYDAMDCSPPVPPGDSLLQARLSSPGKNPGVGCHALLQGVFLTQWSNQGLAHFRQILYHASHQGIKWHPNQSFAELLRHLLNIFWKHEIQARSIYVNSHVHLHSCWPGAEAKSISGRGPGPVPVEDTPIPCSALKTVDSTIYIAHCPKSRLLPLLPWKQGVGVQAGLKMPFGCSTCMC